ncbi:MAG TPA: WXG100 family type VII secretion target, partial [Nonomuraea sp.]|nr:WXG100 family type VII secretion target [Nonomuraea sp.]
MAEQVAQLPGGGHELAGLLLNVSGNPDAIRGIATRWRGAARTVDDHAGRIRTAVRSVGTAWQGGSADAFTTYMGGYGRAGDALHQALAGSATALDSAARELETAKSEISSICGTLLDEVRAFRDRNPDADQTAYVNAISPKVRQAISDARPHSQAASEAVTQAMKDIRNHLGDRETTFAAIKAPGDQAFVPAPGHTVDWRPAPSPGTTLQSAASGGGGGGGSYAAPVVYAGDASPQPLAFSAGT